MKDCRIIRQQGNCYLLELQRCVATEISSPEFLLRFNLVHDSHFCLKQDGKYSCLFKLDYSFQNVEILHKHKK